jgi:DNA-binding GntR family transcriptional regulator
LTSAYLHALRGPTLVHMAGEDPWKYERIAEDLRARIRGGEYAPGSRLPSKGDLKARHGVSDGPVNEALRVLRGEGLIETRQGSGIFVCDPLPEKALSEYEVVMDRIDQLSGEVRQLREQVADLRQAREA